MKLPVFSRLNLRTKRFGVEAADWFFVGAASIVGMIFQSALWGVLSMGIAWVYFSQIKPRRPRGWISSEIEFLMAPRKKIGGFEKNEFKLR